MLHRIQQYALLFCPQWDADPQQARPPPERLLGHRGWRRGDSRFIRGWTAYDLFYYLRSLIPMEIQIRTELANTMAEQYHGPVYKGHPPVGTEFARERMQDVGEELNEQDKEMEIDYENYITNYRLSNQRKEPE